MTRYKILSNLRTHLINDPDVTVWLDDAYAPGTISFNKTDAPAPDTRILYAVTYCEDVAIGFDGTFGILDWTLDVEVRSSDVERATALAGAVQDSLDGYVGLMGIDSQIQHCAVQVQFSDYEPIADVDAGIHLIPMQVQISEAAG